MSEDEAIKIMSRIEACAKQAQMNARLHGGDNAKAAADLLCAFVLISKLSGAPPDKALSAMWENAKGAVDDFWPDARVN